MGVQLMGVSGFDSARRQRRQRG